MSLSSLHEYFWDVLLKNCQLHYATLDKNFPPQPCIYDIVCFLHFHPLANTHAHTGKYGWLVRLNMHSHVQSGEPENEAGVESCHNFFHHDVIIKNVYSVIIAR